MDHQPESCEPMLRESIKHFLAAYRSGSSDFSAFQSIFFRLIQTMPDPPLEMIWFYSAVTFHGAKATPDRDIPPNRTLVMAKDLFQQLISCNDSRNGLKRVALLAPVVFLLYEVVKDSSDNELCLRWEAEDLLHKMVSYVQMSCRDEFQSGNESDVPVACFEDLVRVWTIDRVEESCVVEENLKVFFPVWSGRTWDWFDGRYGIGRLAGIVLCEMFLLRLCLKIRLGDVRDELQKDLQNCAIQTIKTFQNSYFLDMLLKMLLQPTLPITNILSSEDGVSLMRVLYDVLLLVDCSFLNSGRWIQLLDNQSRNLALTWSLVADTAVQLARYDNSEDVNAYVKMKQSILKILAAGIQVITTGLFPMPIPSANLSYLAN
ncbi:OLC1v1029210C2 [Oldenlandia corymbosa var. corymbosa]|uniref:OLC1v1029210C2 n=1 Tax=Oldenlandia corymbosa var. corymbosa TaxID=529605 RepID=A0AAV1CE47_OLDCO|nr:OLC1v1029210C2 [Oldenlandia corymbosa var. corymbosa]